MNQIRGLAKSRKARPIPESGKVPVPPARKHLTPAEVERLIQTAKGSGRYSQRDATLVLIMYRHGLRVSEAVSLKWDAIELKQGLLHVTRLKNGTPSTHPLRGPELRALRAMKAEWEQSPYVFCSERGGPMTASNVRKMIARLGVKARLGFPAHPHQLRHALGYKLAADGVDTRAIQLYLGHKSITHTAHYTALSPDRFKSFFRD